jgi:hypothetical protein
MENKIYIISMLRCSILVTTVKHISKTLTLMIWEPAPGDVPT